MNDITFCGHKECTSRECARHYSHIPTNTPVSVSMFDCPYMPLDYFAGYVEVVRCKDCRFQHIGEMGYRYCTVWDRINGLGDFDFCGYGERREGNGNQ